MIISAKEAKHSTECRIEGLNRVTQEKKTELKKLILNYFESAVRKSISEGKYYARLELCISMMKELPKEDYQSVCTQVALLYMDQGFSVDSTFYTIEEENDNNEVAVMFQIDWREPKETLVERNSETVEPSEQ